MTKKLTTLLLALALVLCALPMAAFAEGEINYPVTLNVTGLDTAQTAGETVEFTVGGKNATEVKYEGTVIGKFTYDANAVEKLEYYETWGEAHWADLTGGTFGPAAGFPFNEDAVSSFRVTFAEVAEATSCDVTIQLVEVGEEGRVVAEWKQTITVNPKQTEPEPEPVYVAKIGDTGYTSLDAALAALKEGDTLTLLGTIEVDGPVVINVPGVTVTGGELKPSAGFARNGQNGSIVTVLANNVTLSGVTVDAGNNDKTKYAVLFQNVQGGKVENCTILNDGWAGILLNSSEAAVSNTTFTLSGSAYAAIELGNGSDHSGNAPALTLGGSINLTNSNPGKPNDLIWTDLAAGNDPEKISSGTVTVASGATLNGDQQLNSDGQLVPKPTPTPDPQPETPAATPAPAPVLDSTPKTGAVAAFALLPLAGLGLAALGVAAKRKEQ